MMQAGVAIVAKLIGGLANLALVIVAIYVLVKVAKFVDKIPELVK
jgi:hypothetical protein